MGPDRLKYQKIYDISILLGVESVDFPGRVLFSRDQKERTMGVEQFRISHISMSAHAGTHLDAPSHLTTYTKTIDQYGIENFILPTVVVNIQDREVIRSVELKGLDIRQGEAVLFRTDNSLSGRSTTRVPSEHYVYLSVEAADFCVEKKVSLVGFDYFAPEKPGNKKHAPVHHKLFEKGILILEGANLKSVPAGRYTMFCLPLKMRGSEGSPVRAILIQ
jgi:arylformamidase